MNKTLYIISLIIVGLTLTSCQNSEMMNHNGARGVQPGINTEGIALQLPAEVMPDIVPSTIQDPILLKAWFTLANRRQTCELWDGYTLTGHELAQYVVDEAVVIAWNTNPTYLGSWVDRPTFRTLRIEKIAFLNMRAEQNNHLLLCWS
jgi:hypothetical protein